jgi:ATP-dependent DNA ligase
LTFTASSAFPQREVRFEAAPGIVLNEHYEGDGDTVFQHACKLGCEGIVSKRLA